MTIDVDHPRPQSVKSRPWLFLGLTLSLTWVVGFAAAVSDFLPRWGTTALHYLGGIIPLAVALTLTYRIHDRPFQRDFWERIIDFRRIGFIWYLVIFLYAPLKSGLAGLIDILLGGRGIVPEVVKGFVQQPILILPTLIFWLFFGPVPEEPGWRGYALDGLQSRHNALYASLVVGVVWSLWHIPLFFIDGTWQAEQVGFLTQRFWLYQLTMVFEAVLYTWIYNNTHRSTLSAILFHFVGNAFGELFELSARAEIFNFMIGLVAVLIVIVIWGPKKLTRERAPLVQEL
ncbi:MAG: type II CAAX prenyl endopeptidase Rce1 family protein [Anaerolineales bacterium]